MGSLALGKASLPERLQPRLAAWFHGPHSVPGGLRCWIPVLQIPWVRFSGTGCWGLRAPGAQLLEGRPSTETGLWHPGAVAHS